MITYKNNTTNTIQYTIPYRQQTYTIKPNEEIYISFYLPESLGLTLVLDGDKRSPVLYSNTLTVAAGSTTTVKFNPPKNFNLYNLTIITITGDGNFKYNDSSNPAIILSKDVGPYKSRRDWFWYPKILVTAGSAESKFYILCEEVD